MNIRDIKNIEGRRNFIEKNNKIKLPAIGVYHSDLEKAQSKNCENMIGSAQVPMGVAGPVLIDGEFAKGKYYLPLATTEGALVASVSRGCKAIRESGGATVAVEEVGATRGSVFKTSGINESLKFKKWLDDNFKALKDITLKTSQHIKLTKLGARILSREVFVRFYFGTSEAMGMNMATIAASQIAQFIKNKTGINCTSVAGNFDIDKKPAWLNFISGRGKRVWAEAMLAEEIIKETLKTTSGDIYKVWMSKCMLGSAMSGSLGFNAHFANIIAALFIATGQDVAQSVEGSLGITTTEIVNKGLYISVYLPDLMVGTVGGGTDLPTQKEALSILGITGEKGSSLMLAEITAAALLAGEISLLSSLAQGSLSSAHQKLARGK